jgi:hypothetical protein
LGVRCRSTPTSRPTSCVRWARHCRLTQRISGACVRISLGDGEPGP